MGPTTSGMFKALEVTRAITNQFCRFEAFDEPWKVIYNTKSQAWEDKWGIMDINRNLKKGLTIPSCNGNTTAPA